MDGQLRNVNGQLPIMGQLYSGWRLAAGVAAKAGMGVNVLTKRPSTI
jgi:hypothetical protein